MSRYDRLFELSSFSKEKFSLLQSKKVLLIGVGGVGQTVATNLITNGIKHLTIVDFDKVELSNLNRQILLKEEDNEKEKVQIVLNELKKKNSEALINAHNLKVDESNIDRFVKGTDIVIDAVDNWKTKLIIAASCKKNHVPLLHIGVDGYKGQWCIFEKKSLLDLFDEEILHEPRDGVMGPMVSSVASLATLHLFNYLLKEAQPDELYYFDGRTAQIGRVKI